MNRTIIMLSAKRCGSTAVFRMFQKHPNVGVCHVDRAIENWEPNFWNLAVKALHGDKEPFTIRFRKSHPFLEIPETFTEEAIFRLWDTILQHQGPILFDKSPQYLGNQEALELLQKYKSLGNDVRIFAFIRDPRDAITSQFEIWEGCPGNESPKSLEIAWLQKYNHLEELQISYEFISVFRYEDFSRAPVCYAPMIYNFCGLQDAHNSYSHIRPTSINRYSISLNSHIRKWQMSEEFKAHLLKYGYSVPQVGPIKQHAFLISGRLWQMMDMWRNITSKRAFS